MYLTMRVYEKLLSILSYPNLFSTYLRPTYTDGYPTT